MADFPIDPSEAFSGENLFSPNMSGSDIPQDKIPDINSDARRKIEDMLEEKALKKLLDEDSYYNF